MGFILKLKDKWLVFPWLNKWFTVVQEYNNKNPNHHITEEIPQLHPTMEMKLGKFAAALLVKLNETKMLTLSYYDCVSIQTSLVK